MLPGTATVESDLSSIKWEKSELRKRLTDFSLEGALHCKQCKSLLGHEAHQIGDKAFVKPPHLAFLTLQRGSMVIHMRWSLKDEALRPFSTPQPGAKLIA